MDNNQFKWQERYNIGVDVIDREHRKLFSIMNKMLTYDYDDGKSKWAYQEGLKFFKGHAMKHFAEEEVYMASIEYEDYDMHRRLHDIFRKKTLPEVEKELIQTNFSKEAVEHFLGVCAGWLIGHTMTEDRAIVGGAASKWTDLLPEEKQVAMKETIIQLLYELFQIDARVISENYGGEKFGNGIYYRLVYGSDQDQDRECFLVFEEKLLSNTVGQLVGGSDSEKVNTMMINATRYTAMQFVERIMVHFPSAEPLTLKDENLLTYEQFQTIFEKRNPQCSLLFDTGAGYFAYCMSAPQLLKQGTDNLLSAESSMEDIIKYLQESDTVQKKKILVVDDSNLMLQVMKELLGNDYDVSTAKSGVSAIRAMTLDKPDLVLLDYEMPVCDGRQVLEMIRAEEELADTPVIFLTGSVDRERLQKIIPLKPAGYLLKTIRPAEIKENIAEYFRKVAERG